MKCKYKLKEKAKKDLKFILTAIVTLPAIAIAIILGALSVIVAIAYPFVGTTANDPIVIDIAAWSVYLVVLVAITKYSWKWLKTNTERCE